MRLVGCYGDPGPLLNPEVVKTVSTEPIGFAELRALAHPKVSFAMPPRWSKPDSNLRSRRNRNACYEAYRVCFKVRARLGMTGAGNGHSPRPRAARTASASTIHHSG